MKQLRRLAAFLLIALTLLSLLPTAGLAASSVKTLKTGTWYKSQDPTPGKWTPYKLKLTAETIVYISWKNASDDSSFCEVDFCKDKDCSYVIDGLTLYSPASGKEAILLYPGTYYVGIFDNVKKVKVKFTTKKASALSAKNISKQKATTLKAGKTAEMAFDEKNQKSRWYKIKLTKKQVVQVTTSKRFYDFTLYNSKLKEIPTYEVKDWVYSTKKKLAKGTYYLKAKGEPNSESGLYQSFSWE